MLRGYQQFETLPGSSTTSDDSRISSGHVASQIHKAIRDGDFAWLPSLLGGVNPLVLWEANCSGWTALHYAASHFLPIEWWRWILDRACSSCPDAAAAAVRFSSARNDLGETVFDIFFQSFLAPLPWQSTQVKNCSKHLLNSMNQVCNDETLLQETRELLQAPIVRDFKNPRNSICVTCFPSATSISVVRCICFCHNLQLLCEAAQTGKLERGNGGENDKSYYPFEKVIEILIRTAGGFPEPFARFVFALYPQKPKTALYEETYLLHLWGASCHTSCCRFMNGIQRPLIEAYPQAASTPDSMGRFPLHYAFLSGKSWDDVKPLFDADPSVLECVDPITNLFPFAVLALPACSGSSGFTSQNEKIRIRARQGSAGDKGLVSFWYIMPDSSREEAIRKATDLLDCECLSSIFLALRAFPHALQETIKVQAAEGGCST